MGYFKWFQVRAKRPKVELEEIPRYYTARSLYCQHLRGRSSENHGSNFAG
jgi:hypothetical protein